MVSLTIFSISKSAVDVTSPKTMQKSVVTQVSQATCALGSSAIKASSTASDMISATLSGWP